MAESNSADDPLASEGAYSDSAHPKLKQAEKRTLYAANRTALAAERTYAAWMRTGIAALATGIGAKTLLAGHLPEWLARGTATLLELFAIFCFVAGVWREIHVSPRRAEAKRLPVWLLVGFNGFLAVVAFAVALNFVFF
jgi:putative membrane protein